MREMLIAQGITIIIVILGFFGNIMYFKGNFGARLKNIEEVVRDLKIGVRYKDTCEKEMMSVENRIDRLENVQNGDRQ